MLLGAEQTAATGPPEGSHSLVREAGWLDIDLALAAVTLWPLQAAHATEVAAPTWSFQRINQADIFPMTHHVECLAILEPVGKGA
ncbi:hypothetical protein [Streptomyces sp. NPDC059142]|uniref:hypothetical protein n=1 Tax=unclassified Streptomyces TaxID=2593676 RepID=UPI0036C87E11